MNREHEEQNRRVVRRHYEEAWNARNLACIEETHAEGCVHHDPSNPQDFRGPAAIRARLAAVQEAFPDIGVTVHEIIAEGDRVAVRFTMKGTHTAPFAGAPPTGRAMSVEGMIFHRLENGKIVEDHAVRDTLGFLVQLGVLQMPAPRH